MTNGKQANDKQNELDRILDGVLAEYSAAEPRAGLEDRVLATLRAEQARVLDHAWWRWGLAGVLTAVVLVLAVAFAWRSGKPSSHQIAQHPSTIKQIPNVLQIPIVAKDGRPAVQPIVWPRHTAGGRHARTPMMAEANPKLDVFPSPRPLSEQEKILENYVSQFRQEAVLIARARTELEIKDQQEEMRDAGEDERQRVSGTTIR
jgi:hypothetical protein